MKSYRVTYDLIKRKDYPELIKALESFKLYWHCLGWERTLRTLSYGCTVLTDGIEGDSYLILLEGKLLLPSTMLSSAAWPSRLVNTSIHILVFRKYLVSDSANTWNLGLPGS